MRILIVICSLLFFSQGLVAQYAVVPFNTLHTDLVQSHLHTKRMIQPIGFAPYLMKVDQMDSVLDANTKQWQRKDYEGWIMRKLKNEHLIEVKRKNLVIYGDAVFNLEGATQSDANGRRLYTNSRGYQLTGTLGERLFFGTSFYESQSIFPSYMDSVVSDRGDFNDPLDPERGNVPGYGRWKPDNTSDSYDYDYTLATGYVGYAFSENAFFQFGYDKQFVGYGHRSLLLSDAASPYPFLRMQLSAFEGKLTYTTTWAVLQSLERVVPPPGYNFKESMFRRLGGRFSYLHFQPSHWLGIGFFDGTTWTWRRNNNPGSIEYYSPHAFFYTGDGIRNHIFGVNGHLNPLTFLTLYGQFARNFGSNSNGYQLGLRLQGLPQNFTINCEYNSLLPGVYYDADDGTGTVIATEPLQSGTSVFNYYQHNDQVLGHPMGIALNELLFKARYRIRDAFVNASYHHVLQNPQIARNEIEYIQLEVGYIINPKSNAQIALGNINRTQANGVLSMIDTYTYLSFRTTLFNRYLDF